MPSATRSSVPGLARPALPVRAASGSPGRVNVPACISLMPQSCSTFAVRHALLHGVRQRGRADAAGDQHEAQRGKPLARQQALVEAGRHVRRRDEQSGRTALASSAAASAAGVNIGMIAVAAPVVKREVDREQAVEMRERRGGEQDRRRVDLQLGGAVRRIEQKAPIVDRHALRRRGGARGVEQQEAVGRGNARQATSSGGVASSDANAIVPAGGCGRPRSRGADAAASPARQDDFGRRAVLALREADRRGGAAVREQRFHLGAAIRHVDGLQRRADIAGRQIAEQEFDAVRQLRRDDVALRRARATRKPAARRSARACRSAIGDRLRADDRGPRGRLAAEPADADRAACRFVRSRPRRLRAREARRTGRASARARRQARRRLRAAANGLTMRAHWNRLNRM